MNDCSRIDSAMSDHRGRSMLLEVLSSGDIWYNGSKDWNDKIKSSCLRWLSLRGVGVCYLSADENAPSELVTSVAIHSPRLKCLHMNYDPNNQMYIEKIEQYCTKIEEVGLRNTWVHSSIRGDDVVIVNLIKKEGQICTLCERPRTNGWQRDPIPPKYAKAFNWRRFLYTVALRDAAFKGQTDIALRLVQGKISNINGQTQEGWTALLGAAWNGYVEIVKILVQGDSSSINLQTADDNRTALMWACEYGHVEVIEYLIQSGADTTLTDKEGKTAFDHLDYSGLDLNEKRRLRNLPSLLLSQAMTKSKRSHSLTQTPQPLSKLSPPIGGIGGF